MLEMQQRMKLQPCVLLATVVALGLCQAHEAPGKDKAGGGEVPVAQLRMLSLGLAHLMQGAEENARRLERQGEQAAAELDGATRGLEALRKQSLLAGRTHKQVRKELGGLVARGDRLWRETRDLQRDTERLDAEHRDTRRRMDRILRKVKRLGEPRAGEHLGPQLDLSSVKVIMERQARRLASLTSDVSARDRMIDRRLRLIDHLEGQVSEKLPAPLGADSGSSCVG